MIEGEYYYVDKTLLIKEVLEDGASVSLFTRPRRFGKTLAMTILQSFFEDERDKFGEKIDNSHCFEGKKIADCREICSAHMGKYPVISLSLKSAKQPDYEMAYDILVDEIRGEFERHRYILDDCAECFPKPYFLFFTGYLKKAGERFEDDTLYLEMEIPNTEIRYIYRNSILSWFDKKIKKTDMSPLIMAMDFFLVC